MSSTPSSDREVAATRAQMELARLLNVSFAADYQSREDAAAQRAGYLAPGLPDDDGLVPVEMVLPTESLQALVEALRAQTRGHA